jgi:hypothetical protein
MVTCDCDKLVLCLSPRHCLPMLSRSKSPGVYQALNPPNAQDRPEELEITDDLEGEQETQLDTTLEDEDGDTHMSDMRDALLQASKGVTEKTDSEYQRWEDPITCLFFVSVG